MREWAFSNHEFIVLLIRGMFLNIYVLMFQIYLSVILYFSFFVWVVRVEWSTLFNMRPTFPSHLMTKNLSVFWELFYLLILYNIMFSDISHFDSKNQIEHTAKMSWKIFVVFHNQSRPLLSTRRFNSALLQTYKNIHLLISIGWFKKKSNKVDMSLSRVRTLLILSHYTFLIQIGLPR